MKNSPWLESDLLTPAPREIQRPGVNGSMWVITEFAINWFMLRHWVPVDDTNCVMVYTTYHMTLLGAKRAAK